MAVNAYWIGLIKKIEQSMRVLGPPENAVGRSPKDLPSANHVGSSLPDPLGGGNCKGEDARKSKLSQTCLEIKVLNKGGRIGRWIKLYLTDWKDRRTRASD